MAKEKSINSQPEDTNLHSNTYHTDEYGTKKDRLLVPGEGLYLSKYAVHDMEHEARQQHAEHGQPTFENYHRAFISESQIEQWHAEIQTHKKMVEAGNRHRAAYEATCYEGTDTQDPTKGSSTLHDSRNEFELDRSKSTIHLTICTGDRFLNGSAVRHHHYVSIGIDSPDGRELVQVAMTFDQFASFLVSSMETPCTIDHYWDRNDHNILLKEVVKPPESINDRMVQRLDDRLDELRKRIEAIQKDLDDQIATGKPMSKTKLAELRKATEVFVSHFDSNRNFTVQQAKEEVASIVEQAAASIAWEHKLEAGSIMNNPQIRALLPALSQATQTEPPLE